MKLPMLFHWSPANRREAILRDGLQIYSEAPVPIDWEDEELALAWPWLCFASDPGYAWALCPGGTEPLDERSWDLWLVTPSDNDDVRVLMDGASIKEVRIANTVPPDRIWYVATREPTTAKEIRKPGTTLKKAGARG